MENEILIKNNKSPEPAAFIWSSFCVIKLNNNQPGACSDIANNQEERPQRGIKNSFILTYFRGQYVRLDTIPN